MIMTRKKIRSGAKSVRISLPKNLDASEVEIVIRPVRSRRSGETQKELLSLLASFPTFSKKEIAKIEASQTHLRQWRANGF